MIEPTRRSPGARYGWGTAQCDRFAAGGFLAEFSKLCGGLRTDSNLAEPPTFTWVPHPTDGNFHSGYKV